MSSPERDVLVADVLRVSPELAVRVAEAIDAAARFGEATLDALRAEVEALRAALAPFAAVGTVLDWRDAPDDLNPCPHIPMALYRRAAALLGDEEEG